MIAVAAPVLPHQYPRWSDGYEKHMTALLGLWLQLRPAMARHRLGAVAIDLEMRAMMSAFSTGDAHEVRSCAIRLYRAVREAIDAKPVRRPFHPTSDANLSVFKRALRAGNFRA